MLYVYIAALPVSFLLFILLMFWQVVGLGESGRAAARLALARGASVLAIDKNEQLVALEVCLIMIGLSEKTVLFI